MGYRNLQQTVADLEINGRLIRIENEVDPYLELGSIQRRVYAAQGPALLFTNVKGCSFPMLGNLFGTLERARWIFRDSLKSIEALVALKINPAEALKKPASLLKSIPGAFHLLPDFVSDGPVLANSTKIENLPKLVSWPMDGGPFVTLPQVYSESPANPGIRHSNLGMYRVQLSGNSYRLNEEVGIHYQIHRGLGVHHAEALELRKPLRVNVFVGGPPSMTVAAVMPLPEGMPELAFAGLLGGHRLPLVRRAGELPIPAESDFCISGVLDPHATLPEGPFGDHLGYYSLVHDFPVLKVDKVYHRNGAIWPFTTVGRPPQEDTTFGAFIHELTGDLIPTVLPGVRAVHAVDAAGVHPLLLAVGSERYLPYAKEREPQELLTSANAILGQGQLSLAKYLFIAAHEDNPPDIHNIEEFLMFMLERVDWRRDLHFQTQTTIDTLDYSGNGLNKGSKVVIAAAGEKRTDLLNSVPSDLQLPDRFSQARICIPGIMAVQGPECTDYMPGQDQAMLSFCDRLGHNADLNGLPVILVVDDSEFTSRTLNNWLWIAFTRSNPAADIYGIISFVNCRHWGCKGPIVIDARIKPHHSPLLIADPDVEKRVDALGEKGGILHGII